MVAKVNMNDGISETTTTKNSPPFPDHLIHLRYEIDGFVIPGDRIGSLRPVASPKSSQPKREEKDTKKEGHQHQLLQQNQIHCGDGVYVKSGHLYASMVGRLQVVKIQTPSKGKVEPSNDDMDVDGGENGGSGEKTSIPSWTISVQPNTQGGDEKNKAEPFTTADTTGPSVVLSEPRQRLPATAYVPRVGQKVVGTVLRLTPQNAIIHMQILEGVGRLPNSTSIISNNSNIKSSSFLEGAVRMEDVRSGASQQFGDIIAQSFQPGDWIVAKIISYGDARRYFLSTAEPELGVIRAKSASSPSSFLEPIAWNEMECPVTGKKESRKCARQQQKNSV